MTLKNRALLILLFSLVVVLLALPVAAQDTDTSEEIEVPSQIEWALANLSQRLRVDLTLDSLSRYEWVHEQFGDASLGCPTVGMNYAQVITPGYQFLLSYGGVTYDYRVSEDGEIAFLCDTRPVSPGEPLPPEQPPVDCGDEYVVQDGDNLIEIADQCGTSVAALLRANPDIEDPSLIFENQILVIPDADDGAVQSVSIRPDSGPPGTIIRVYASGYPAGAQVQLGMGAPESEYTVVATREIALDGELVATLRISPSLQAGDERVAVVALNNEETISETFTVTEGVAPPEVTPTEPATGMFERTQIYLVALGDAGRSGQQVGCGDSLIPVTVTFEPTPAPLTAALESLFAIDSRTYGQSGLVNALYQSDLTVEGIDIRDGEAFINLSGMLRIGGVCDAPRVTAQLEQTALQYSTIDAVSISLNGEPLEAYLNVSGA